MNNVDDCCWTCTNRLIVHISGVDVIPKKESSYNVSRDNQKGGKMVRGNFTPEQIINKLREAEIHINQGILIAETSRKIGVTRQTYYRWRKEYGGLRIEQAKKLKHLVADLSSDNVILKEASGGKLLSPSRKRKVIIQVQEPGISQRPGQEDAETCTMYQR